VGSEPPQDPGRFTPPPRADECPIGTDCERSEALIDTSAVYHFRVVVPILEAAGERGVISDQVEGELQANVLAKGRGYPAHPFGRVRDEANAIAMARMRQQYRATSGPGDEADIIIGTTSITTDRRLYSSDDRLVSAVRNSGGRATYVPAP
jgi:predicted nucleic acid-binding protein